MGTDFKTRAHQLLELAHKAGLEAAEVYQMQTKTQLACFDANHLKQIENREAIGLALRIWNQGKPGLAVAKGNVALPQVLEQAIGLSELSPPQEIQLPKHQLCTPDLNRGTSVPREQLVDWGKSAIINLSETSLIQGLTSTQKLRLTAKSKELLDSWPLSRLTKMAFQRVPIFFLWE